MTEKTNSQPANGSVSVSRHAHLTPAAITQLFIINVLWGGSSAAAKWGLASFGPFTLATLRFLPAGLLLWLLAKYEAGRLSKSSDERPGIRRRDWPALWLLGIGVAVTYGLMFNGLQRTNATDASLLFACEPLLIALFALIFLNERLNLRQWSGLALGLAGVWLIAGKSLGNGLAVLALAVESSVGIVAKRLTHSMAGLMVIAWQVLIGAALLTPLAIYEVVRHPPNVTWRAVCGLLYLCLVNTVFGYGIWYHLMNRFPVSAMGAFILLQPLTGPLFGYLLLGDLIRPQSLWGGALIVFGIGMTVLRFHKRGKTL